MDIKSKVEFRPKRITVGELKKLLENYEDEKEIFIKAEDNSTFRKPIELKGVEPVIEMDVNLAHPTLIIGDMEVIDNRNIILTDENDILREIAKSLENDKKIKRQ